MASKSKEIKGVDSHDEHEHHVENFWTKYVFSMDHKMIGKQFLVTGMIMGVVAACVCMIAFGGFVFIVYTRTQKKTIGNHSRMVDDDSMVLEMTSNTNPMNNNMPVADAVIINETNQYYNKKGTDKGNWSSHQTPEGDTYFHDQVSGRTTWTNPNPSEESKTNNRPPQHVDRPSSL